MAFECVTFCNFAGGNSRTSWNFHQLWWTCFGGRDAAFELADCDRHQKALQVRLMMSMAFCKLLLDHLSEKMSVVKMLRKLNWKERLRERRLKHTHTLAQNGHCELWSGMYRTCTKNTSVTWKDWTGFRKKSPCSFWLKLKLKLPNQLNQIAQTVQKLKSSKMIDMPVLGLAGCHFRKFETAKIGFEKAGTQSWSDSVSHTIR